MTVEDFREWVRFAALTEQAQILDAMAFELVKRDMRLNAAALRIDAHNLRHYASVAARQMNGPSVTDELPHAPRADGGGEGRAR